MSKYEEELALLESTKCPTCHGHGEYDDAELGDISCRTFKCGFCKGTGKKPGSKGTGPTHVDIVFDGSPGHDPPRFIEVEDHEGKSISFGEWVKRADGYHVLRIRREAQ